MGETGETFGWCLEVEPIAEKKPDSEERLSDFCNEIVWSSQYVGDLVRCEAIGDLKHERHARPAEPRLVPAARPLCARRTCCRVCWAEVLPAPGALGRAAARDADARQIRGGWQR